MSDYSRRELRRMGSLFPMVFSWLADTPTEQRARLRVLDLPGGVGLTAAGLVAAGFEVVSADLMPERGMQFAAEMKGKSFGQVMREATRRKGWISKSLQQRLFDRADPKFPDSFPCAQADLEARLPFEDESFDIALCVEGIEHISDRMGMLREFRRILPRGGKLIVTTPNLLNMRARLSQLLCGFRTLSTWIDEYSGVQMREGDRIYHGHAFMLDYNELRYSLFHAGFKVTRVLQTPVSRSSAALKWLLWPLVWLGTWRVCFLGERKFEKYRKSGKVPADAPNPAREIRRHLMSRELLYGRNLAVEAEAI